jgi:hypothetical protein
MSIEERNGEEEVWMMDDEEKYKSKLFLHVHRENILAYIIDCLVFYERSLWTMEDPSNNILIDEESRNTYASCRMNFNLLISQITEFVQGYKPFVNLACDTGNRDISFVWINVIRIQDYITTHAQTTMKKIRLSLKEIGGMMKFLGFEDIQYMDCAFLYDDTSIPFQDDMILQELNQFRTTLQELDKVCKYHVRNTKN